MSEIATAGEPLHPHGSDGDDALLHLLHTIHDVRDGAEPALTPGDLAVLEQLTDPITVVRAAGLAPGVGHHDLAGGRACRVA